MLSNLAPLTFQQFGATQMFLIEYFKINYDIERCG